MKHVLALACAAALLALSGAAGAVPTSESKDVPPNLFMERDLQLAVGTRVPWNITLAQPEERAVYNIHTHHENGTAEDLVFGLVNGTVDGVFEAPRDGAYSWMVTNALSRRTLNITIALDADPEAIVEGTNPLPGWEGPLLLAAAGLAAFFVRRPGRPRASFAGVFPLARAS